MPPSLPATLLSLAALLASSPVVTTAARGPARPALGAAPVPLHVTPSTLGRAAADPAADTLPLRVVRLDGDDFSDLDFLRERLRGVRIVQLGESGHGMAEASRVKARLVRFLHEEMGFDVVAFESSLYQCHDADARAGRAPAETTLLRCLLGVWHTEEVLPLFAHLRSSRTGPRPLRLAGFDIQPIGSNKDHRPAFLARVGAAVDPALGRRAAALDSSFLAVYTRGGSERRARLRERREELVEGYESFAGRVEAWLAEAGASPGPTHGVSRADALVAARTARSMASYVRMQTAPDMATWAETRDRGMADNVVFLAERLFPGRRIVLWAANYHVRHANQSIPPTGAVFPGVEARAMGGWLRERYGSALYTVGVYAARGTAVDNARGVYEVTPAPAGSLEALATSGRWEGGSDDPRPGLAIFRELSPDPPAWATRPVTARYNGLHPQVLVPTDQYDALILLPGVTPPVFLY